MHDQHMEVYAPLKQSVGLAGGWSKRPIAKVSGSKRPTQKSKRPPRESKRPRRKSKRPR